MPTSHELEPLGDLVAQPLAVVTTDNSVWLIDTDAYTRLPRTESASPYRTHFSDWGRLQDGLRHPHRGVRWVRERSSGALRLQIFPILGPPKGHGILTGWVVAARGLALDDAGLRAGVQVER